MTTFGAQRDIKVRKRGDRFAVVSGSGNTLGTHRSRAAAERQVAAINIEKARKRGARIPAKRS